MISRHPYVRTCPCEGEARLTISDMLSMLGDIEKSMRHWPVNESPERRKIMDRVMLMFDGLQHARWERSVESAAPLSEGYYACLQDLGMVPKEKR